MTGKRIITVIGALLVFTGTACTHRVQVDTIKTEHLVEVKPMEMTINVNVNVRVDKALEDFFGDIDKAKE